MAVDRIMHLPEISSRTTVPEATLKWWKVRAPERGPRLFKLGGRIVAKERDVEAWIDAQYDAAAGDAA